MFRMKHWSRVALRRRKRSVLLMLGSLSVFFLFGTLMVLPLFNDKSGLDILNELIGSVEEQTVDIVGD